MTFKLFSVFEDHVEVVTNICMQALREVFIFISLGQFLRCRIGAFYGKSVLKFIRNCQKCFFKMAVLFQWLTVLKMKLWFFFTYYHILFVNFFYFLLFSYCPTIFFFIFSFIFISWRLITLQYCSGFCHTLTSWTPILNPLPTSLPIPSLWVIPVHQPWKMVMIALHARQKKRHRCVEQTFGLYRRRWGWDDLRE